MSTHTHSQAPWVRDEDGSIRAADGTLVTDDVETEEDAALIAAAPDMLAALKAISRAGTLHNQAVIDQMIAAIAKAEGRS